MTFKIEFAADAVVELSKLEKSVQERVNKKIDNLQYNPELGKPLARSARLDTMIWELRFDRPNLRVYYSICRDVIIVESIKYEGKVNVLGVGDKNSQRRDISGMM